MPAWLLAPHRGTSTSTRSVHRGGRARPAALLQPGDSPVGAVGDLAVGIAQKRLEVRDGSRIPDLHEHRRELHAHVIDGIGEIAHEIVDYALQAVEVPEGRYSLLMMRGKIFKDQGRYGEAIQALREAQRLEIAEPESDSTEGQRIPQ